MADIRPFVCVHPSEGYYEKVAALPYDVYHRAEAKSFVAGRPCSFLNIDRPETQFPDDQDMYADIVYEKAAEMFDAWIRNGILKQEQDPCYFIYSLTMNGREQSGIVAGVSMDDYLGGIVRRHENTLAAKEVDRIRHVDALSAQTGPIFLAFRQKDRIRELVNEAKKDKPLFDFVSEDGIRHAGYRIHDPEKIRTLSEDLDKLERVYIADGHHRCASAAKVALKRREENPGYTGQEDFNYFLSVLFPDDELKILPYNRLLKSLNGMPEEEFLQKISRIFRISPAAGPVEPEEKGCYGLFIGGRWYLLRQLEELVQDDSVEGLDVAYLQRELLTPVLGIADPKNDSRIDFAGGIRGTAFLEEEVLSGHAAAAISMYPTSIGELFAVADEGRLMPPKSTWFEPKLRSGLFIHRF